MPTIHINDVELFYELSGSGEIPVVLVHGSWVSHHSWDAVVSRLEEPFRVLTYDRRGHSRSERPAGQGSIREDVADLAALIEQLGLAPAWVVGNSAGASIALRLAAEVPQLLLGLAGHEPPLFSLLADDPDAGPMLEDVNERFGAVVARIAAGDHAGAAEQFVDTVVLGPGAWAQFEADVQKTFVENAPTFLDEAHDPDAFSFDPTRLKAFRQPVLLTTGDQSPPLMAPVVARLAAILPNVQVASIPDAGHIPHATHPDAYLETVMAFIHKNSPELSSSREPTGSSK